VNPLSIVVLISGTGSNLQALIDAIKAGTLKADIRAVISNRSDATGLQRAQQAGIATHVIKNSDHTDRSHYDAALRECIDRYQPQLVILAGFMRILGAELVNHYRGRMLNIHPSLLPDFRGLDTHQRVLDAGRREHGASVHFVTPDLDSGPVVLQAVIAVNADDTAQSLQQRVHQQEHIIYPMAVGWFAEGRLRYQHDEALLDGTRITQPPRWINGQLHR
jgi:phosphoribosylglycinamide formyltransferase-1